jgi:hypothetical protein
MCTMDAHCDDGKWCTQGDMCVNNVCVLGKDPCLSGEVCDEVDDVCVADSSPSDCTTDLADFPNCCCDNTQSTLGGPKGSRVCVHDGESYSLGQECPAGGSTEGTAIGVSAGCAVVAAGGVAGYMYMSKKKKEEAEAEAAKAAVELDPVAMAMRRSSNMAESVRPPADLHLSPNGEQSARATAGLEFPNSTPITQPPQPGMFRFIPDSAAASAQNSFRGSPPRETPGMV